MLDRLKLHYFMELCEISRKSANCKNELSSQKNKVKNAITSYYCKNPNSRQQIKLGLNYGNNEANLEPFICEIF